MMFSLAVFLAGMSICFALSIGGPPVDCVPSVWSEWKLREDGSQSRTRIILKPARNGGRPCGVLTQVRGNGDEPANVFPEDAFLSRFIPGNRPSYRILDGDTKSYYTVPRDIIVLLDTTIPPAIFPFYISMMTSLVDKFCGEMGTNPENNRVALATFDSSVSVLNDLSQDQTRSILQDKIAGIRPSHENSSNLLSALSFARGAIINETFGARGYILSTKEVLIVTSYSENCTMGVLEMAQRLRTVSIVYNIIVGEGVTTSRPDNWCFEDQVASKPRQLHFLQLENAARLSQVTNILQTTENSQICQTSEPEII